MPQVVDALDRDRDRLALEVRDVWPGIWNVATTSRIAAHRLVGRDLERRREQVAVEDHVQVLVGRDPGEQLLADRVVVNLPVLRCETRVASSWNDT